MGRALMRKALHTQEAWGRVGRNYFPKWIAWGLFLMRLICVMKAFGKHLIGLMVLSGQVITTVARLYQVTANFLTNKLRHLWIVVL